MNITYTGKQEHLHPKQKEQLDSKLGKIAKLLEASGKPEKQAHVILVHDKNHFRAEITLNYLDHTLVGEHLDGDQFTAFNAALEKLEKQMIKVRDKRRDIKKGPREGWDKSAAANGVTAPEPDHPDGIPAGTNGKPKVYRVRPDGKPLTVEEALLLIDDDAYLVYREAQTDRISVLLKRADGNFDLIEC